MCLRLKLLGLGMIGALIAACGSESSTAQEIPDRTGTNAASTSTLPTTSTVGATTTSIDGTTTVGAYPVEPLSALTAYKLDYDRLGPIVVGMTLGEASAVSGVEFRENLWDGGTGCTTASPLDGEGVWMILMGGRIAAIHVGPPVVTVQGARYGTSETQILQIYGGDRVEMRDHPYGAPVWHMFEVSSPDPKLSAFRLVFDTDGSVVTEFRAGWEEEALLAEGCA